MPNNLQSDITEVRARLGEPYRTDEADSFFLDSEIIDWIYFGELKVWNDLPVGVLINGTSLWQWSDLSAGDYRNGFTDLSTMPTSYRLARVSIKNPASAGNPIACRRSDVSTVLKVNSGKSTNWGRSITQTTPQPGTALYAEDDDGTIYLTNPSDGNSASALIVLAPTRRYKHLRDTSAAAGNSGTHVIGSAATIATFTANSFFNGCGLKVVSKHQAGASSTVTAYTAATGDFTIDTITTPPGQSFLYEVGEPSQFNDNLREPCILHACYLAALKDESPERAAGFQAMYDRSIAALKGDAK